MLLRDMVDKNLIDDAELLKPVKVKCDHERIVERRRSVSGIIPLQIMKSPELERYLINYGEFDVVGELQKRNLEKEDLDDEKKGGNIQKLSPPDGVQRKNPASKSL